MHDPMTVAHEVYLGKKQKKNGNYRTPFITIWHVDPENDGTDDSCGWFIRDRHTDQKLMNEINKEFEFNFKHNYWFTADGMPKFSTQGIVLNMYKAAAWKMFYPNYKKYHSFFRNHLHEILAFAENPVDSLNDYIVNEYRCRLIQHDRSQVDSQEGRIKHLSSVVYCHILRKTRKWYKHPKWHIHHWKIQFHPYLRLKRRYWDKCCICGKRGFKGSAHGAWNGTKIWHSECDKTMTVTAAQ